MAGYSGTPLAKKLGIKPAARVALLSAPDTLPATLDPLPEDVRLLRSLRAPLDVVLLFTTRLADLERRFPPAAAALAPAGGLWVAWPKRASGVATDLGEAAVRELGLASGLVDNKVCAIDDTWSGLRFVIRLRDRWRRPALEDVRAPVAAATLSSYRARCSGPRSRCDSGAVPQL